VTVTVVPPNTLTQNIPNPVPLPVPVPCPAPPPCDDKDNIKAAGIVFLILWLLSFIALAVVGFMLFQEKNKGRPDQVVPYAPEQEAAPARKPDPDAESSSSGSPISHLRHAADPMRQARADAVESW
jgi:hypothetical protein